MPRIQITTQIDLELETAAKWFANLNDDEMCKFLVLVAKEAEAFPSCGDSQWYYLGGHLRNCECSTDGARKMIESWYYWMQNSDHK